jgi:hypothetical protein
VRGSFMSGCTSLPPQGARSDSPPGMSRRGFR